jgi:AAA domain
MASNVKLLEVLHKRALQRAAIEKDGGRNDTGLWLACQLRDNGYSAGEAESAMQQYAAAVGSGGDHEYTEAEAVATVQSAFSRPPRQGWGESGNGKTGDSTAKVPPPLFPLLSSPEFSAARYKLDWLAKHALVRGQPVVIGGPMKTLETSVAIDLAVSLSTATSFLGQFQVGAVCSVAVLSGESGEATLQETAQRICRQRMRLLSDCKIWWGFKLPQLARIGDLSALGDALQRYAINVLILDPLYLSLLAGDPQGRSASNLFDMGPLLLSVASMAADCGCTPIFLHHFKKGLASDYASAELQDLAFSGVAEFARQWLLLSRREQYEPGSGKHALWLSIGGSAGHSGLYALDVDEGTAGDDFTGRIWQIDVQPASDARAAAKKRQETEKRENDLAKALDTIRRHPNGETRRYLAEAAGMRFSAFNDAADELMKNNRVVACDVRKPSGKTTRNYPGIKPA